jgi:phosphoglycolate phosphatase-like HAD superfamily hydrolase
VLKNAVTQEYHHVQALKAAGGEQLTTSYWFPDTPNPRDLGRMARQGAAVRGSHVAAVGDQRAVLSTVSGAGAASRGAGS